MVKTEVTLDKTTTNNKGNRLDLLAEIDQKEQINVEIQTRNKYNIVNRSLYYGSTLYRNSLEKGQDYNNAKKTIVIMILDYNEFKEGPYHEVARLRRDFNNEIITDKIEFHYIQLPKFIESVKEIKGDEEIWLAYISNQLNEKEKGELINMKKSIQEINAIVDEVMNDEEVYNALTIRELDEYDRRSALSYAEEKGMAKGLEKGKRENQIEVAKKLLENKIDIDIIIKTTGLTKEEIENIDELEREIN